jgi:hypothetical protein
MKPRRWRTGTSTALTVESDPGFQLSANYTLDSLRLAGAGEGGLGVAAATEVGVTACSDCLPSSFNEFPFTAPAPTPAAAVAVAAAAVARLWARHI